jgi:hypothetical protein
LLNGDAKAASTTTARLALTRAQEPPNHPLANYRLSLEGFYRKHANQRKTIRNGEDSDAVKPRRSPFVFLEVKMADWRTGKWNKLFSLYMTPEMAALLAEAAESQHIPATAYARQAVAAALRRDGYAKAERPENPRRRPAEATTAA